MLHRMETFVLKRTMKVIQTSIDELINKEGCDASNMFDEEVHDPEFSDDEQEKLFKKQRKQKNRAKNLEDGEI